MPWLLMLSLTTAPSPPAIQLQGFVSAGVLRTICLAPGEDPDHGADLCLGYVAGVADGLLAREAQRRPARRKLCIPAGVAVDDLRDAVLAYLPTANAADDVGAAPMVRAALEATFPCGAPKGR